MVGHDRSPVIASRMTAAYSAGASSQTKWPASISVDAAVRQPLVQELGVGDRNDPVVAAVDDRDRRRDLRQQLGELGQFLGVPADVAHRLDVAVAVVTGQVVRADLVGYAAGDRVDRDVDDRAGSILRHLSRSGSSTHDFSGSPKLDRNRRPAAADDHACDALGMRRRREQRRRGSDVGRDDVRSYRDPPRR